MAQIEVLAHKKCTAKFVVIAGTKEEAKSAIAQKLRSGEGIVWTDDSDGVSAGYILDNHFRRIQMRFNPKTLRLESD